MPVELIERGSVVSVVKLSGDALLTGPTDRRVPYEDAKDARYSWDEPAPLRDLAGYNKKDPVYFGGENAGDWDLYLEIPTEWLVPREYIAGNRGCPCGICQGIV